MIYESTILNLKCKRPLLVDPSLFANAYIWYNSNINTQNKISGWEILYSQNAISTIKDSRQDSTWKKKKKITKNYIATENGDKHNNTTTTTTTTHPKRFQSEALLRQMKKLKLFWLTTCVFLPVALAPSPSALSLIYTSFLWFFR